MKFAPACTRVVRAAQAGLSWPSANSPSGRPLRTMFVGASVGDGVLDVPVCEANNHRRWFQKCTCLQCSAGHISFARPKEIWKRKRRIVEALNVCSRKRIPPSPMYPSRPHRRTYRLKLHLPAAAARVWPPDEQNPIRRRSRLLNYSLFTIHYSLTAKARLTAGFCC